MQRGRAHGPLRFSDASRASHVIPDRCRKHSPPVARVHNCLNRWKGIEDKQKQNTLLMSRFNILRTRLMSPWAGAVVEFLSRMWAVKTMGKYRWSRTHPTKLFSQMVFHFRSSPSGTPEHFKDSNVPLMFREKWKYTYWVLHFLLQYIIGYISRTAKQLKKIIWEVSSCGERV